MIEVTLPSLGVAILDAKIVNWLKEEGNEVKKDEPIVEVETDKVTFEIVSPINGFLVKTLYNTGELVKVNEALALVNETKETDFIPEKQRSKISQEQKEKDFEKNNITGKSIGIDLENKKSNKSTPAAKHIIKQNNLDINRIAGTGPDNVVTKKDVLKYLEETIVIKNKDEEIIPFEGTRKEIAKRLTASKNNKVQVTTTLEIDVTDTEIIRNMLKTDFKKEHGINLTLLAFVVKAAIEAIKNFPIINSTLSEDQIIIKKYINFGIAVESPKGLIVPVIHKSEKLSFWKLIKEIDTLIKKARNEKLTPKYIGNGTITISNAGSFGSNISTPIIHDNQSALLWMGKVTKRPIVDENDQIKIRKIMNLCISYDHQIIDGALIAQFANEINIWLENPAKLLIGELNENT
ncbi:MAG: dihydrolipoamide acetyltransferase family protein [Eubacteriales bacterium]